MPRHPTARRVHRPPAADDDAFVAGVLETTAWAKTHRRALVFGGIGIIAAALFLFLFFTTRSAKREQAMAQLTQVRGTSLSGNNQLAIRELEQYVASYGGTPPAAEARLLLARAYLDGGQVDRAIETIARQARDVDNVVGVNAAFLLAAAHETAQQYQRAEEVYLRVADRAEYLFQKQEALDNAARLRIEQGDAAGAAQLYERILTITPITDGNRQVFELRAGEARAAAAAATGASGRSAAPGNRDSVRAR